MARKGNIVLDNGDSLPDLEFDLASGEKMVFPRDAGSRWRVLFIYRGHW